MRAQPWIHSPWLDLAVIIGPAFVTAAGVLAFPDFFSRQAAELSILSWFLLVVGVDVAHVYGTLYRTYLDREEVRSRPGLYTLTPLLGWALGTLLHALSAGLFWSVLAYLAVFHFIRQQYGFLRIYSRQEPAPAARFRRLDEAVIYMATLAPLIYWHTHLPRSFHWFVVGDFRGWAPGLLSESIWGFVFRAYQLLLVIYAAKEAWLLWRLGRMNLPRNLLIAGTSLSWYVGIVRTNGDLSFTLTNVVAHGIPYLALVWTHGRSRVRRSATGLGRYAIRLLPSFAGLLLLFAYVEEGLWDGLIWKEHLPLFPGFSLLPTISDPTTLAWLVPLLALPQITHYLLDGFIWRTSALSMRTQELK